jgi:hypothetical protein
LAQILKNEALESPSHQSNKRENFFNILLLI